MLIKCHWHGLLFIIGVVLICLRNYRRQYLIIEGDYTFAPLAIPYERLYHGVTEAYSDDSMDAAAGDRVNNASHDTTDTSGWDFSSEPI